MKTTLSRQTREQGGAMIAYLAVALVITAAIAALAGYVVQNVHLSQRRQDMVNGRQFAEGGDASTGVAKSTAQGGDVIIDGAGSKGDSYIDGGIIANGAINTNLANVKSISEGLYGSTSQIPDYTNPGSSNQLFNFSRFIAAADAMGTHYTNASAFMTKM